MLAIRTIKEDTGKFRPEKLTRNAFRGSSGGTAQCNRSYGIRAVIGKGGMGAKTSAALQEHGAVYLNAIGGAAQFYARTVEKVLGVHLLDFGIPEAMWHLKVNNFAAIVTMDALGNSLHRDVEATTGEALAELRHA